MNTIKKYENIIILKIILLAVFLRVNNYHENLWFDEYTTIWYSNIDNNIFKDFARLSLEYQKSYEPTPKFYFTLLQVFFLTFGYDILTAKIFNLIIVMIGLIFAYKISHFFLKSKKVRLVFFFLISTNVYLIWQTQEVRPHIFFYTCSMLQIFYFLKMENDKINKNYLNYLIFSLLTALFYPFIIIIMLSQFVYFLCNQDNKKHFKKFFLINLIIAILYFIVSYDYIIGQISNKGNWAGIYASFFYSYFFNVYFGNKWFGGAILLIILFLLVCNYKKIFIFQKQIAFLNILIFITYFFITIYSVKNGVLSPRNIIYIITFVYLWIFLITEELSNKYVKSFLIIILVSINIFTLIIEKDRELIPKPPFHLAINEFKKENTKKIASNLGLLFNNYFSIVSAVKKNNFQVVELNENTKKTVNKIWLICKNNMRSEVKKNNFEINPKCENKYLKKFDEKKHIKFDDIQIKLFEINLN